MTLWVLFAVCTIPALSATKLQFIEAVNCKYPASVSVVITMYPGEETRRPRPALLKEDVAYLLEKTTFDEYDVREWFREFIKTRQTPSRTFEFRYMYFHSRTVRTGCSPRRRYFAMVDNMTILLLLSNQIIYNYFFIRPSRSTVP